MSGNHELIKKRQNEDRNRPSLRGKQPECGEIAEPRTYLTISGAGSSLPPADAAPDIHTPFAGL